MYCARCQNWGGHHSQHSASNHPRGRGERVTDVYSGGACKRHSFLWSCHAGLDGGLFGEEHASFDGHAGSSYAGNDGKQFVPADAGTNAKTDRAIDGDFWFEAIVFAGWVSDVGVKKTVTIGT